jgi:hypothetical protein
MARVARVGEARRKARTAAKDAEARWRAIGKALRACMTAGEPPSSPRAVEALTAMQAEGDGR